MSPYRSVRIATRIKHHLTAVSHYAASLGSSLAQNCLLEHDGTEKSDCRNVARMAQVFQPCKCHHAVGNQGKPFIQNVYSIWTLLEQTGGEGTLAIVIKNNQNILQAPHFGNPISCPFYFLAAAFEVGTLDLLTIQRSPILKV